jgi:hypothetical protein
MQAPSDAAHLAQIGALLPPALQDLVQRTPHHQELQLNDASSPGNEGLSGSTC